MFTLCILSMQVKQLPFSYAPIVRGFSFAFSTCISFLDYFPCAFSFYKKWDDKIADHVLTRKSMSHSGKQSFEYPCGHIYCQHSGEKSSRWMGYFTWSRISFFYPFLQVRKRSFRAKCVYVAIMLRRMMEAILNKDAMDDKVYYDRGSIIT